MLQENYQKSNEESGEPGREFKIGDEVFFRERLGRTLENGQHETIENLKRGRIISTRTVEIRDQDITEEGRRARAMELGVPENEVSGYTVNLATIEWQESVIAPGGKEEMRTFSNEVDAKFLERAD